MIGVEITQSPRPQLIVGQFIAWGMDIRSFREPLKRSVQQVVAPSIQQNFDAGGRPPWQPLSEDTIRQKQALGQDNGILQRSGKLKKVAGQVNAWSIDSESATITGLPGAEYGFVHQDGYEPNIPVRQFLTVQDDDLEKIDEIFGDWVIERAMKAGLFGSVF